MIEVELNMKKRILVILLVIGVLAFNIITVNADENPGENFEHEATRKSSPTVRCKYDIGTEDLWLINYEGIINYNFIYSGSTCSGTTDFEANTCPDWIDVFNPPAMGSGGGQNCNVGFEEEANARVEGGYDLLQGPLNVCVYTVADVDNTNFILFHDGTNWVAEFVTGSYVGQPININDSFSDNNTHQCPSRLWISMNNQSNNLYDENPNENAEWEELGDNLSSDDFNKEVGCEDIINMEEGSLGWLLNTILNYIKIIGPVLVVLLSAIDFIKAVVGTDEKAMKEAQSKLVIRLVAAIGLFLVPTLVQLLLSFINATSCPLE